ncbi:hypothetical protein PG994_003045 [Apiospora phragmitis]|uniref:Glycosyltransferase family 25 protein n=1 Tax=Apiospora phragmitis TaxID=2905665 RepID=A0ABR1W6Z5_9PEZI
MRCGPRPPFARVAFVLIAVVCSLSLLQFWHLALPPTRFPHVVTSDLGDSSKSAEKPAHATADQPAAAATPSASASPQPAHHDAQAQNSSWGPRNSTLGFDAVLALSKGGQTWRVQGLHAAGALTDVKVTIPPQPTWTKEMIEAFAALGPEGVQKPGVGSAAAWLAHIDLLKYVIQSGLNSALIMEDDVDWDVNIKDQLSQAAETVRKHTKAPFEESNPYSSNWDILWLGHCGDIPRDNETFTFFQDPTVVAHSAYEGFAAGYVNDHFPEGQRAVYRSQGAICTYAYAVNQRGVRKVLEYVSEGQEQAFDTKLFHGCRAGALDCISVNPELFRHFQPDEKFGQTSEVDKQNWGGEDKSSKDGEEKKQGAAAQHPRGSSCSSTWPRRSPARQRTSRKAPGAKHSGIRRALGRRER